jgi:type II secretory pathway pseudopilin PulG
VRARRSIQAREVARGRVARRGGLRRVGTRAGFSAGFSAGSRASSRAGFRAGFTIFELALVLLVLASVTILAIQAHFSSSDVTLENAARLLAADLRAAQASATLRRTTLTLELHADGGGYPLAEAGVPDARTPPRRYPADGVFEDVRIGSVRLAEGSQLSFDAHGEPSTDAWITLTQRDHARTVSVERDRARVLVEGNER